MWGLGRDGKELGEMRFMLSLDRSMEKQAKIIKIMGSYVEEPEEDSNRRIPILLPKCLFMNHRNLWSSSLPSNA